MTKHIYLSFALKIYEKVPFLSDHSTLVWLFPKLIAVVHAVKGPGLEVTHTPQPYDPDIFIIAIQIK